ncbi:uncharacterized protein LOC127592937 isoform X1 [Hippocampus zosterae]|uniref:uncharacterized protein LOC127592937 isoform X1 n=1 Tax=Hippocampus zosterae TaxID=109293 RepID=UPI00223D11C8|nr:uncharacterized protein LOC127592937 isoform X1 [Hippocampus zosterae]
MRHGTRLWNGWTTRGLQPKTNSDMFFFNLLMHFGLQLGILLSLALLVAAREREHEEVTREPCVFVDNGPMTTTLELSAGTPPKKLQQKARRQAKQKKSKSAEFLMARVDAAGTENPAFDAEPCLLPVWPAREIQGDRADSALAAPFTPSPTRLNKFEKKKKMELRASAKERGAPRSQHSKASVSSQAKAPPRTSSSEERSTSGCSIAIRKHPWTQSALTPTLGSVPCGGPES